jgi:hypothetical protein
MCLVEDLKPSQKNFTKLVSPHGRISALKVPTGKMSSLHHTLHNNQGQSVASTGVCLHYQRVISMSVINLIYLIDRRSMTKKGELSSVSLTPLKRNTIFGCLSRNINTVPKDPWLNSYTS